MDITIQQDEIEKAVEQYVRGLITVQDGHQIGMDFKNGRGDIGISATISITAGNGNSNQAVAKPAAPKPVSSGVQAAQPEATPAPVSQPAQVTASPVSGGEAAAEANGTEAQPVKTAAGKRPSLFETAPADAAAPGATAAPFGEGEGTTEA